MANGWDYPYLFLQPTGWAPEGESSQATGLLGSIGSLAGREGERITYQLSLAWIQ